MTDAIPLARALARFVLSLGPGTIPPQVEEKARCCLLNGYGIALGCHDTPYAPVARAAAVAMDGERADGATLWGDGRRVGVIVHVLHHVRILRGKLRVLSCVVALLQQRLPLLKLLLIVTEVLDDIDSFVRCRSTGLRRCGCGLLRPEELLEHLPYALPVKIPIAIIRGLLL